MSIALDGFEVLERLGEHPDVFAAVRADVDKAARALVVKCMKAKSVNLDGLRKMYKALGKEQFELLIEGLKDADVKSVLTRLDKHHPELKSGSASWRSQHLEALAGHAADPSPPTPKAAKKAPAKKTKAASKADAEPKRLHSEVMDIYREGSKRKG